MLFFTSHRYLYVPSGSDDDDDSSYSDEHQSRNQSVRKRKGAGTGKGKRKKKSSMYWSGTGNPPGMSRETTIASEDRRYTYHDSDSINSDTSEDTQSKNTSFVSGQEADNYFASSDDCGHGPSSLDGILNAFKGKNENSK